MKSMTRELTLVMFGLMCGLGLIPDASAMDIVTKANFWGRMTAEDGSPVKGLTGTMVVTAHYADGMGPDPAVRAEITTVREKVTTDGKGEYRFVGNFHRRQADAPFEGGSNKIVSFEMTFEVDENSFGGDTQTFGAKLLDSRWNLLDLNNRSYEQWANGFFVIPNNVLSAQGLQPAATAEQAKQAVEALESWSKRLTCLSPGWSSEKSVVDSEHNGLKSAAMAQVSSSGRQSVSSTIRAVK